jgi:5-oxopent-3-ene-1,2,5-tricarboxylate decarboxylase / 2-hydroxyhepta-2,4-diene-1,7-dioate isomerase
MKRGRVRYQGQMWEVTEQAGNVRMPTGTLLSEAEVQWLPPIVPRTTFGIGLNYANHAKELSFAPPTEPLVFLKAANTFTGHRQTTPRPADVTFMHYECELAVVIGRTARRVTRERALDYVGGYTVANDYALRDYLENFYRPNLRVKSRDRTTPLGPWLVDAGDIPDPMNLGLRVTVNGTTTLEGSTRQMIFGVAWLIEYLSDFMTLSPGDLILTGTPDGLADCRPGDEVMTEVEGIGRLINTIVAGEEP